MHIERWKLGIEILKEVKQKGLPFDINHWFANDYDKESAMDQNCPACAIGHMIRDPRMQTLNFTILDDADEMAAPVYHEWEGWAAIDRFFDIDDKKSSRIFGTYIIHGLPTSIDDVITMMEEELVNHTNL